MKASRIFLVVIVVFVVILIAVFAYAALVTPSNNSIWSNGATYPLQYSGTYGVMGQQCVNSTTNVVCIGGIDAAGGLQSSVYTSSVVSASASNITGWTQDGHSYKLPLYAQSCVASSGYIYCVGGTYDDQGDNLNSSYFASLSSAGAVGPWTQTTSYPDYIDSQSCVASSGYIYCIGGFIEPGGLNSTGRDANSLDYYAPISSSGIGQWTAATSYPTDVYSPSCSAYAGYVYCVGGVSAIANGNALSDVYTAPLSAAGIGNWVLSTPYPVAGIGQACALSSGSIYCVGGDTPNGFTNAVYYATASSGAVGTWAKGAVYSEGAWTSCVIISANMYCVGGQDGSSNGETGATHFLPLAEIQSMTTTS